MILWKAAVINFRIFFWQRSTFLWKWKSSPWRDFFFQERGRSFLSFSHSYKIIHVKALQPNSYYHFSVSNKCVGQNKRTSAEYFSCSEVKNACRWKIKVGGSFFNNLKRAATFIQNTRVWMWCKYHACWVCNVIGSQTTTNMHMHDSMLSVVELEEAERIRRRFLNAILSAVVVTLICWCDFGWL